MSSVSPDTEIDIKSSEIPVRISPITGKPVEKRVYTKKAGRPSKYKKHYAQDLIDFFDQSPWIDEVPFTITSKNGNVITKHELRPKQLRFLNRWCINIGITTETVHLWRDMYPDFNVAYVRAKELYKEHLAICGAAGLFNSHFTQFLAKNTTDWTDRSVVEHDGKVESTVFFENMLNKAQDTRAWLPSYTKETSSN